MDVGRRLTHKEIDIYVVRHRTTGLLIGLSEALRGLMIVGETGPEIESKIPGSIRELLEAEGHEVVSVTVKTDTSSFPASFESAESFSKNVHVEMAH